VILFDALTPLK